MRTFLENEDLSVKCISPKPDAYYEDMNQYSAIISISFGRMHVIITGDAGKQAEYTRHEKAPQPMQAEEKYCVVIT